jgi:hypothetical protein
LRIANNTIGYQGENPGITLGIRSQQKMISGLIEMLNTHTLNAQTKIKKIKGN